MKNKTTPAEFCVITLMVIAAFALFLRGCGNWADNLPPSPAERAGLIAGPEK